MIRHHRVRPPVPAVILRAVRMGVLLATALGLAAACSDPDPELPADARVRIDTVDGVPHVISGPRGALVRGGSWRVPADSGLLIGETDGPEEYTFGRVGGLLVGPRGRIYVGDAQALEVRVFSPTGEMERRFGRKGEGPGEFTHIGGISRAPDGIAVLDGNQGRVMVFSPRGERVRSFRLQRPYPILQPFSPSRFDHDGRFLDRTSLSSAPLVDSLGVVVYSPAGDPEDTVHVATIEEDRLVVERRGVPVMAFSRPFSPQPSLAIAPDGLIYFSRGDQYSISVLSPEGDTLRVIRRELRPRSVSDEERETALTQIEERYREVTGSGAPQGIEIPTTKPMIASLHVDQDGNLWVLTPSEPSWRHLEWAVHDPEGRYLGPVATPRLIVADIGDDYIAGVQADELGVERVAIYPLRK